MPSEPDGNGLADKRNLTLMLRLVIDAQDQLIHGEILDAQARSILRFRSWLGLLRALRLIIRNSL